MTWKRDTSKDLVIYRNTEKPQLTIQRRPGSPVFWVMKSGEAVDSAMTFPDAAGKAGALA